MRRQNRHRGYVLVTTLLLVSIAAVAMASLARASLNRAVQALDAERELQRRWGMVSLASAVLPRAEQLLRDAEEAEGRPVARLQVELELGHQRHTVIVADEQAKLNLNALYRRRGPIQAEQAARELIQQVRFDLRLRPFPAQRGRIGPTEIIFETFDQVLENASAADLAGTTGDWNPLPPATEQLTLWGDGRVQFRRASDEVIAKVCEGVAGPGDAHRLLAIRQADPQISLSAALDELQARREVRQRLEALLTDISTCQSVWMIAEDDHRLWHQLIVMENTAGRIHRRAFAW